MKKSRLERMPCRLFCQFLLDHMYRAAGTRARQNSAKYHAGAIILSAAVCNLMADIC